MKPMLTIDVLIKGRWSIDEIPSWQ